MNTLFGVILVILSSIGWLGQCVVLFSPALAVKLGVTEPEADVDPVFYADVRGEAYWDAIILWILPVAGILLLFNHPWWPYFGLVGGGMYLYLLRVHLYFGMVQNHRAVYA